ncbi:MAG TPA: DUF4252 domain-containing protein [Steroidobacteraceae bacterium]|nr:DUF4252 domain-containing protein [Steroidobacteraceae bacterium]
MKVAITVAALAATVILALPGRSLARGADFRVPEFSHLRAKASETVDVNVGGFLLGLARMFTSAEDRENDPDLRILDDIKSVRVRSYKFDSDDAYTKADVDAVRSQLKGPQWNAMVQVHKREAQEDVDVFVCVEDNKTCGLAVIATQPREFTVVSIVGSIDIERLSQLEGEFGIPKLDDGPPEN